MSPTPVLGTISEDALAALSESSRACIERLCMHEPDRFELTNECVISYVLAAVLVLLYERAGGLRVLLTTRSKELRSHPGQTALPGGKVDQSDAGVVETAFREANEEVGLPLRSPHVHTLCSLEPFVSPKGVLVTPVIAFLDDVGVLDGLQAAPGEVACIFDHPLEAVLEPELLEALALVPRGSDDWPYEAELHNFTDAPWLGSMYRLHRFRSTASPVKGLTADILLATAGIAYARESVFPRWGPGQWRSFGEVQRALEAVTTPARFTPPPGHVVPTTTTVRA
ncbi:NUDIX hydrolase domain-like protein [Russula ochroleuca]|uniref:NUDIX hydrolase domain-like protein n=1 Tax=Russula ochroleuca TaxID=152965 RepID=A0A9P5N3U4_9AGAM|nr:NUDIX hydrolase domain-like protein [Russula ochroleuca]